jgi:hypothetical protein
MNPWSELQARLEEANTFEGINGMGDAGFTAV